MEWNPPEWNFLLWGAFLQKGKEDWFASIAIWMGPFILKFWVKTVRELKMKRCWVFQHDNDPKQTIRETQPVSRPQRNQKSLEEVAKRQPLFRAPEKICAGEWAKIPTKVCVDLVKNQGQLVWQPFNVILLILFTFCDVYLSIWWKWLSSFLMGEFAKV